MTGGYLNLAMLKPWWFRLLLLIVIGSPLFTSSTNDLHLTIHVDHPFADLGQWVAYALFIWLFIGLTVGLERLVDWLSFACILALTVVFTGAVFRQLGIWEYLEKLVPQASADPLFALIDLTFRFIVILVAIPFGLLFIQSFPASDIVNWISKSGTRKKSNIALGGAIFLRMLQNVSEVIENLIIAWREENPAVLLPQFRADWRGAPQNRLKFFDWIRLAIWAWCVSIVIHSFQAIPGIVRDFRRARDAT